MPNASTTEPATRLQGVVALGDLMRPTAAEVAHAGGANDNFVPRIERGASCLPPDARAILRAPDRHAGQARRFWSLTFAPRSPQRIEPLMGWVAGSDTLRQVELRFPTREAALDYCRRQGLAVEVVEPKRRTRRPAPARSSPAVIDLEAAKLDPAAVFARPRDVLEHSLLTHADKRAILRQWEWDARLIERAADEGMPDGEPSRLAEVRAALAELEAGRPMPMALPANAGLAVLAAQHQAAETMPVAAQGGGR